MTVPKDGMSQGIRCLFSAIDALLNKSFLKLDTWTRASVSHDCREEGDPRHTKVWSGYCMTYMTTVAIDQNNDIWIVILKFSAHETCTPLLRRLVDTFKRSLVSFTYPILSSSLSTRCCNSRLDRVASARSRSTSFSLVRSSSFSCCKRFWIWKL